MSSSATRSGSRFRLPGTRPVVRDPEEAHRAATPLELLFDLCFVVGVAQAAAAYHHELVEDHVVDGLVGFAMGFFAVWWGWMGFTWFASAHDADDLVHRLVTLVQMTGALVVAAGIARAVEDSDFSVVVVGYAVMRLGLVVGWLRVASRHAPGRTRALRYAGGITAVQVLWIARLALGDELVVASFAALVVLELAVPFWAESALDAPLFHPEHIEERYGLFTIIVLGESILSATVGFQGAVDSGGLTSDLVLIGVGGLVLAFGAWWLYFDHPGHLSPSPAQGFRWGYAHVIVFASLAALGAGVHVAAEAAAHHADERVGALAVSLSVAGFLLGLVVIMVLTGASAGDARVWPKLAGIGALVAIGLLAPVAAAVALSALVVVVLVAMMVVAGRSGDGAAPPA